MTGRIETYSVQLYLSADLEYSVEAGRAMTLELVANRHRVRGHRRTSRRRLVRRARRQKHEGFTRLRSADGLAPGMTRHHQNRQVFQGQQRGRTHADLQESTSPTEQRRIGRASHDARAVLLTQKGLCRLLRIRARTTPRKSAVTTTTFVHRHPPFQRTYRLIDGPKECPASTRLDFTDFWR